MKLSRLDKANQSSCKNSEEEMEKLERLLVSADTSTRSDGATEISITTVGNLARMHFYIKGSKKPPDCSDGQI